MQTPTYLSMLETHGLQFTSLLQQLEDDSHSLIMYRSGQRSVVEWIQHQLNEENNG
jgi:hypothetical protein